MTDVPTLKVYLNDHQIGVLVHLPGDKNLFTFDQAYIDNPNRPILSLSFKDAAGELATAVKTTRTRLPPFFANLLPEGQMSEYLARRANVSAKREYFLLAALGYDLPGAITVHPAEEIKHLKDVLPLNSKKLKNVEGPLRFSLAGVQLKFSAIKNSNSGLIIPANGIGGSWIVKLPSHQFKGVPENEYTMMELARRVGIDVPETMLVPLKEIESLPKEVDQLGEYAFVIKRFDRTAKGKRLHIEDFAQVFGVYPEEKYQRATYRNIAEVINNEIGQEGIVEFIRRFVYNALIGNGDMHLKNWSLLYTDKQKVELAPAYDFVSTLPYIPNETLALNFVDSKEFHSLSIEQFKRFSAKARLESHLVLETIEETVAKFAEIWKNSEDLPLEKAYRDLISVHLKSIPIFKK